MGKQRAALALLSLLLLGLLATGCSKSDAEIAVFNGVEMVRIPAGEFTMGSNDGPPDVRPAHTVYLETYYIDRYEVTNAEYKRFLDATGHPAPFLDSEKYPWAKPFNWENGTYPPGTADWPVVLVSWDDAQAYASWRGCRLPTEAEWEKAARGTKRTTYPWGETWDPYNLVSRLLPATHPLPADSSLKDVSPYGVIGMAGNVREWCTDWYDLETYTQAPKHNPTGPDRGSRKVVRGGSWLTVEAEKFAVYYRGAEFPSSQSPDLGFRCVRALASPSEK